MLHLIIILAIFGIGISIVLIDMLVDFCKDAKKSNRDMLASGNYVYMGSMINDLLP